MDENKSDWKKWLENFWYYNGKKLIIIIISIIVFAFFIYLLLQMNPAGFIPWTIGVLI